MRRTVVKAAIVGAVCSLLGIFPVAGLWAFVWMIPVPFHGWAGGWEGLSMSPAVVLFLGIAMGGIPALAICGAIGGAAVQSSLGTPNLRYVSILAVSLMLDIVLTALAVVLWAVVTLVEILFLQDQILSGAVPPRTKRRSI